MHVTHWQRALVNAQFGMGREVAALPQSVAVWAAAQVSVLGLQTWSVAHVVAPPLSHEQLEVLLPPSVLETQNEPRLQSVPSQKQRFSFRVDPSVILQAEAVMPDACKAPSLLHVLSAAMQNMPVVPAVSQSTLPHAQADGLAAEPSDIEQTAGGLLLQVLVAETQYMPVVSLPVHAAFPQMQGAALLGADPSVFVQAGAVRVHMHVRVVEQDAVEEVSVLKYREPEDHL